MIYLDHMASTPLDPQVREAMLPWLEPIAAGNPHSRHGPGWRAADAVEAARGEVAALIGARPSEIVFTSGATEANNLALFGAAPQAKRLVVSAIEHPAVLEPAAVLECGGMPVARVPVGGEGMVDLAALEAALADGPALVSVMAVNNETGSVQPLEEIGALCRRHGAVFHSDAVQAMTTQAVHVDAAGLDLVSLTGHKLYAPIGIGALYVRSGLALEPRQYGGGQQQGVRPGTVPVALCVALGASCRIARERRDSDAARLRALRERLWDGLSAALPGLRRNGQTNGGHPGCLNVSLPGCDTADLLLDLPGLALSTGSACSSGEGTYSHVLKAIGLSEHEAHGSLRFGLGRGTTADAVDEAVTSILAVLRDRRAA